MDDKTRAALEGSIMKWENIVAGHGKDDGVKNCPLCKEFWRDDCNGCPVKIRTGRSSCVDSPYEYVMLDLDCTIDEIINTDERERTRDAAKAELDFLISLRPKD